MNNQIKYILNIAGTGILVIVLLGVIFFWTDRLCDNAILDNVKPNDYGINISPSGLIENESEIKKERADKGRTYIDSAITTSMNYNMALTFGMIANIMEEEVRFQGLSMMSIAYDMITDNVGSTIKSEENSNYQRTYFDKDKGLFVNCTFLKNTKSQNKWAKRINYYIGPEGIGNEPAEQLGRFINPLISDMENPYKKTAVLYDKGLKRFFSIKITTDEKTVTKGGELDSEKYNPVQISGHRINKPKLNVLSNGITSNSQGNIDGKLFYDAYNKYLIVVNGNGRIDLLDSETLELKPAGNLPEYIKQQHSYSIQSVFLDDSYYSGLVVSTISSDFRIMYTSVFDATGNKIHSQANWLNEEQLPGGLASLLSRYIIESLQPAGFEILSYLTAHNYDGVKSQQAMFIRPNSAIASFARDVNPFSIRLLGALVIMGPSLIIGVLLGWRVSKRAKSLGLSKLAVRLWTYGTIFTGIAGYLTFRFTKHAETMVTCKNCGQLRQVEQETC
ncbi:MAG TPA: hypothetical protein PLP05_10970, partial [Sedimentisphaerales bacterium]|nr:hypothetical protein [Sedimentisphaerales bacterium]